MGSKKRSRFPTSSVQKHGSKLPKIVGGGKQSCMTGNSAKPSSPRIVDYSAEKLLARFFGWCNSWPERTVRAKTRITHSERFKNLLDSKPIERFAGQPSY
jgi:hypothetical protein